MKDSTWIGICILIAVFSWYAGHGVAFKQIQTCTDIKLKADNALAICEEAKANQHLCQEVIDLTNSIN